jgi:dihydropteroate synthase
MSSRPGAPISSPDDEIKLLLPAVTSIRKQFPSAILSVDTLHSKVARAVLDAGVQLINDISAGTYDAEMLQVVAESRAPFIMMHMKGLPSDMQLNPEYDDVTVDILSYFTKRIYAARNAGITDLIIDPGFGFGKTLQHNYTLLSQLDAFGIFDVPVLAGISRKSMIWRVLHSEASQALNGTTALHMVASMKGASILRVHDVREAKEVITLHKMLTNP